MSTVSTLTPYTSCPNFDPIFTSAFRAYKKKTGKDITSHPLAAELETCHCPDAILTVPRAKIPVINVSTNGSFQRSTSSTRFPPPSATALGMNSLQQKLFLPVLAFSSWQPKM